MAAANSKSPLPLGIMKVLHLVYREDGGNGRAAIRMHHALRRSGVDSVVVLGTGRASEQDHIYAMENPAQRFWMRWAPAAHRRLLSLRYGSAAWHLRSARVPGLLKSTLQRHQPDVVHLQGIFDGLVSAKQVAAFPVPVVWTLHDMLPFSPGYHYRGDLMALPVEHGPLIDDQWSPKLKRLASDTLKHKTACLGTPKGAVTAPSTWLAREAQQSEVFRRWDVSHIHYAFSNDGWPQTTNSEAKAALGLASDSRCVLFGAEGASAPRKGADLLLDALNILPGVLPASITKKIVLLVFGESHGMHWKAGGIPIHHLGRVENLQTLAQAYTAADVFVCPSREDNSPNTVIEALACGTPAIAFRQGGLPDLIKDGKNGFLVPACDTRAMAQTIGEALAPSVLWQRSTIQREILTLSDPAARSSDFCKIYHQLCSNPGALPADSKFVKT
jgi:glycosyltransferase involved in cell wall biosynthesis